MARQVRPGAALIGRAMEALGVSGGGWWWQRRRRRAHVISVRTAWVRAGLIVRYGPVGVVCHGLRPRHTYGRGVPGAAGIAGDALAFEGQGESLQVSYRLGILLASFIAAIAAFGFLKWQLRKKKA